MVVRAGHLLYSRLRLQVDLHSDATRVLGWGSTQGVGPGAGAHRCQHRLRAAVRRLEGEKHTEELAAGEIRHQRDALAEKMLEDYGIDMMQLTQTEDAQLDEERESVEVEIADLRRKIDAIGNVNLDALEELVMVGCHIM